MRTKKVFNPDFVEAAKKILVTQNCKSFYDLYDRDNLRSSYILEVINVDGFRLKDVRRRFYRVMTGECRPTHSEIKFIKVHYKKDLRKYVEEYMGKVKKNTPSGVVTPKKTKPKVYQNTVAPERTLANKNIDAENCISDSGKFHNSLYKYVYGIVPMSTPAFWFRNTKHKNFCLALTDPNSQATQKSIARNIYKYFQVDTARGMIPTANNFEFFYEFLDIQEVMKWTLKDYYEFLRKCYLAAVDSHARLPKQFEAWNKPFLERNFGSTKCFFESVFDFTKIRGGDVTIGKLNCELISRRVSKTRRKK